jgi:glycerol uptake facilitator-like aquaporin
MAQRLFGANAVLALLANAIATGGVLVALILAFGPVSGAHFNPVVTLADASRGGLPWRDVPGYVLAQFAGAIAGAVGAYIVGAYWFTPSTSFANPAVTLARSLTDTFAGIRPADVAAFMVAQLAGAALATALFAWLAPARHVATDLLRADADA